MARYDDPASLYDDPGTRYDDTGGSSSTGDLAGAERTTLLLSSPFDSAFYMGAPVLSDAPYTMPVVLNGHGYRVDLTEYQRNTLPALRPPQDNSSEPGEQSLNTESLWRRSAENWILGQGQSYFDDVGDPPSNRSQYFSGLGIDPWTKRQLTLLHDTRNILPSVSTNAHLIATPSHLYCATGSELSFTANPESEAPVWFSSNIQAGDSPLTVEDVVNVGSKVYAALGANGIHVTDVGSSTSSQHSAYAATLLGFVNGWLIATKPGEIASVAGTGAPTATATVLYNHFDDEMAWTDIIATPNGAYICGNSLGKAEIFFIGINTSTGALLEPIFAGSLPDGETINCMAYYQGLVLLGTSAGLRLAQINQSNGIEHGPLIRVPAGVTAFEPQGEYCWFSWANYDGTKTGLGRALLSRNTEPGIPAYATDLMAAGQGQVPTIATFNGRRYFGVAGVGLFAETEDYVQSGRMDSGIVRFGTAERKIAVWLDVRHDALPVNGSVTASLVLDDGRTVPAGVSNDPGTLGPPEPYQCSQSLNEALRVVLVLRRGATDTAPVLRRWTLGASIAPVRQDEIIVPLIIHEVVNTSEESGSEVHYDTLAEFLFLKSLEGGRQVVPYQEGGAVWQVQVDRVMVRPEKFNSDHTYFNGRIFVRLLTIGD